MWLNSEILNAYTIQFYHLPNKKHWLSVYQIGKPHGKGVFLRLMWTFWSGLEQPQPSDKSLLSD